MRERTVCGFSTIDNISLLNIEGTGMIGVPGIAHRLFGALKAANISVMFIAQASSEHSVCFATKESQADRAKQAVLEAFFFEFKNKIVSAIRVIDNCSIIAAVGEGMSNTPGVSGLFFGALGSAAINVLSIAQGCDERNISAVVYTKDATRALRAVHAAFWLSSLDISIGIVGTGRVGSALLQILLEQSAVLGSRFGFKLKVRGVANSRKMLLGDDLASQLRSKMNSFIQYTQTEEGVVRKSHSNVSLQDMETAMSEQGDDKLDTNLTEFFNHINSGATPHAIVIDASTSHDVAQWHPKLLSGGMHVVTANKRALSSKLELYNSIVEAVRSNNRMYMSEVTIGASLPVRTTLHDILCSGDAVHAIEGLMSVSLGMILTDMCDEGMTFTEALLKTYRQGLFEDDVFADLEGIEVAEKLLILARELGIPLRVGDVQVEPIAKRREVINWDNLGDTFADVDKMLGERLAAAKSRGCTLRYIQRIECTPAAELGPQRSKANAYVRLEEVPRESRLAMVKGAVYHFAFHTERYKQNPLVVQVIYTSCCIANIFISTLVLVGTSV